MNVQITLAIAALMLGLSASAGATTISIEAPASTMPAAWIDQSLAPTLLEGLEEADLRDFVALQSGLDLTLDGAALAGIAAPAPLRAGRAELNAQARAHHAQPLAEPIPEPEIYTMFLIGIAVLLLAGRRRDNATARWRMIRVVE
ncbi:PEP-CTERM sorting domain-containing protein [Rugamonas sp. CCM 8940]|uniref:PEP-CTERM sorting domain-containing protein n=1 Tax=Rugamonas sp. CCM 8940 TaxID=2765359 RepID=UPI0018F75AF3|nr:PEP-CTERM sorting domain-containing protein [Rugamonas sp. CCM 8940]MBJ7310158.1 hypothetical protein [Rugamonas sp. CCM 8940]